MRTASAFVEVRCAGCREPRQVTVRQSKRAGLCRNCLYPPKPSLVTDRERRFWLKRFDDTQLALLASDLLGHPVDPATIHANRVALIASATPDE